MLRSTYTIRLEPIGGIAGDMFLSAASSVWPVVWDKVKAAEIALGINPKFGFKQQSEKRRGMAANYCFFEDDPDLKKAPLHYPDICTLLQNAGLGESVTKHSLGIFATLAEAESKAHGIPVERVHFHEIADWDSIADIVAAAIIIDHSGEAKWTCTPLPIGGGQIKTNHGIIPIPPPATQLLCSSFPFIDDGVSGERVTPTGAAILRYLFNVGKLVFASGCSGTLEKSGSGCGKKDFTELPNILRFSIFSTEYQNSAETDNIAVLTFDVDDQTPEDLAIALDHLRELAGVLDIVQYMGFGKKGRVIITVRILATVAEAENIAMSSLSFTSTIGVRLSHERRIILPRESNTKSDRGTTYRIKSTHRPDGSTTKKLEADDQSGIASFAQRLSLKRDLERDSDE